MATVLYFWHGFNHRGATFTVCTFSITASLFITICHMLGRRHSPSARLSLLLLRTDRPIVRINSSLVLYRDLRSSSFTLAKRSQSHGLMRKRRHLMVQNPIILHGNVRSHTAAVTDLLHQNERTTTRDPAQYTRWTYPCYRAVNTEHQQRWTHWWCKTPYKHVTKVINKGVTILKVHKCCTPVNKAMLEISNCCHYFLSNTCTYIE